MVAFEVYIPILRMRIVQKCLRRPLVLRCEEGDRDGQQGGQLLISSGFPSFRQPPLIALFGTLSLSVCIPVCGLTAFKVLLLLRLPSHGVLRGGMAPLSLHTEPGFVAACIYKPTVA